MTDKLKEQVKSLGVEEKVIFTGYMNDIEKTKMYKISDITVIPSLYEPFGIVALEAMAAGCPLVVSDVGGLKEIVEHGVNGMRAINGSKDSIKDNILILLKDEELRNKIIKNGYDLISNKYSWDSIAQDTIKLYEKIQEEAKGTEWEVKIEKPKKKAATSRRKKTEKVKDEDTKLASENKTETKPKTRTRRTKKAVTEEVKN
jgi:glycogen synthase